MSERERSNCGGKTDQGVDAAKKIALIEDQNPRWEDLAADWYIVEEKKKGLSC